MSQQRLQIIWDLQKIIAKFVACRTFYISSKNSAADSSAVRSKHAIWDEKHRVVTYLTKFPGKLDVGLFTHGRLVDCARWLHIYLELSEINIFSFQTFFDIQLSVLLTVYLEKALHLISSYWKVQAWSADTVLMLRFLAQYFNVGT